MIEQFEAMPLLVGACPSFAERWHEHLSSYGNETLYAASGAFAHHLLSLQQASDVSSFPAVAATIERLCNEGSPWVKQFVAIGLLEDIQNVWSNNSINPELFGHFLGPESRRWWQGLNNFWSGNASLIKTEG